MIGSTKTILIMTIMFTPLVLIRRENIQEATKLRDILNQKILRRPCIILRRIISNIRRLNGPAGRAIPLNVSLMTLGTAIGSTRGTPSKMRQTTLIIKRTIGKPITPVKSLDRKRVSGLVRSPPTIILQRIPTTDLSTLATTR